jgi:hypothetical protein
VFERARQAGGAFLLAGKAPMFQGVEAREQALLTYIESMVASCRAVGVEFRFDTDALAAPDALTRFDRVVHATGAAYRFGLGAVVRLALNSGAARLPGMRALMSRPGLRDWFYHRARIGRGQPGPARPGQHVQMIGDARRPGKSKEAVADAYATALHHVA